MDTKRKIAAISELMMKGIISTDEFSKMVAVLNGASLEVQEREKTPAELAYERYIREKVAPKFKSPSMVKFPPFDASMVKKGLIKLDLTEQNVRYIETYVDAPNSYGTMLREPIIIGIDENFTPLFWAQHLQISSLLGKQKGWTTMSKG
ncbi:MAG: hypothetical protein K6C36_01865 [Clostridia bacterium]|nr:hypothetical protein [Clostridia bacterium]